MNKFKYYFIVIITSLSLFSCSKNDDSVETVPLRDYGEQYKADNDSIEKYLNNYYIEKITQAPGDITDQDIKMTKIPAAGTQASIMSLLNSPTFPKLLIRNVTLDAVQYKLYYLVLREGIGERPTNVDGIFTAYKGTLLNETIFDQSTSQQTLWDLKPNINGGLIEGWRQVFPQFRTGTIKESDKNDGTLAYNDFGAGVMFLPSGLAYFGSGSNAIPAYTPIVFSFKLYGVRRDDSDGDGIPSYLEDIDGDGYLPTNISDVAKDDSDGDGTPDYVDIDDDGDSFTTRSEITVNGVVTPFASIPDCSGNTTNPTRTKKYLDKNCH